MALRGRAAALALALAGIGAATLASVWALDRFGYTPCELCLIEREPFYEAVPLALATAAVAWRGWSRLAIGGFALLGGLFIVGAGLGLYHAGVEWQFWPGPSGCSGAMTAPASVNDFLKQLNTVRVVRCDAAAFRVFGLSLAGWNGLLCACLATLAFAGVRGRPQNA